MDSKQNCSKAIKRIESKKRKIQAFLDLTKGKSTDVVAEVPIKKSKIEVDGKGNNSSDTDSDGNKKSIEQLRREMRAKQKAAMEKPKLYLTLEDLQVPSKSLPSFAMCQPATVEPCYLPLFIMDLQHLLVYAIQGNTASYKPRWCKLLRWNKISHVIVLILNDVSLSEYDNFSDSLPYLKGTFEMKVEMVSPSDYGCSVLQELFHVPLSISQLRKSVKDRSRKEFKAHRKEMRNIVEVEVIQSGQEEDEEADRGDSLSLVDLLLSPQQMIEEHYPLPVCVEKYPGYMYSQDKYEKVSENSPMFAVDCEMCLTTTQKLEVTRVSVVNEKLEVVYETLVKPHNTIINYMTRYSGITKAILKGVSTRLKNVQETLKAIMPSNAVLCGHSLNGDLHALKMYHPYVIDTSVIYNLSGQRRMKPGLKRLAFHFLQKSIQESKTGHDPSEDASASMELVLLKLKNGGDFGDTVLTGLGTNLETKSEAEELTQAANSLKKTTKEDKQETEIRQTNTIKCEGCDNCRQNGDSTGESDGDSDKTKACPDCGQLMDTEGSSTSRNNTGHQCKKSTDVNKDMGIKKKVFFERPGTKLGNHFCLVCKENKHSVSLVGPDPEFAAANETCCNNEKQQQSSESSVSTGMSHHNTTSDKKTARITRRQFCSNFVTVASFHGFNPYKTDDDKKEMLSNMDKQVRKVLKRAPSNSLVSVVLGGHSDPIKSHPALTLVKITR